MATHYLMNSFNFHSFRLFQWFILIVADDLFLIPVLADCYYDTDNTMTYYSKQSENKCPVTNGIQGHMPVAAGEIEPGEFLP